MKQYKKISIAAAIESASPAPKFELTEERIEKLKSYADVLLEVLRLTTVLTMVVVAPNALQALKIFEKKKTGRKPTHKESRERLAKTIHYMRRHGLADIKQKGQDLEIVLSGKAKKRIKELDFEQMQIPKPKRWDRKFWQVAVDIPVKKRGRANLLREKFKQLGLYPLQRSVWFYPHDPRAECELASKIYEVEEYITFMRVDKLEPYDEDVLKKHFKQTGEI